MSNDIVLYIHIILYLFGMDKTQTFRKNRRTHKHTESKTGLERDTQTHTQNKRDHSTRPAV